MKFTKLITLSFCIFYFYIGLSQENAIGVFTNNKDIGNPKLSGSASYDDMTQTYTIKGAGYNIWGERDEHRFLYNKIKGDFLVTANFRFEGYNEEHRKIGWMARSSEKDNSAMIGGFLHGDGLTAGQWRETEGATMTNPENDVWAPKRYYEIIQLERRGNTFTVRAAHVGEPLQEISTKELPNMPEELLTGIVISSHVENKMETAKVWNVRIDQPVEETYDPFEDGFIGCRMETMNVFDGTRKVIYEKGGRFEAPNWMPDGKSLLFNMDGGLFTIPTEGGEPSKLNTGNAKKINNDHCISFNGQMLAISHDDDDKGSNISTLPLKGGQPKRVTNQAPSYLHGWSHDDQEVVYVAQRNGAEIYDIYKKNINGGNETKLTDNNKWEHVDGCEYSPDGKYIYYNGNTNGGTMQLWRMKLDGTQKEQITFDAYNDWFPHISPDGKWIAFISFEPDIELNAHPSYQPVMLRLMPTTGGAPKVIANLYGGQGTINVNSWSPDSNHIAFVSNSKRSEDVDTSK